MELALAAAEFELRVQAWSQAGPLVSVANKEEADNLAIRRRAELLIVVTMAKKAREAYERAVSVLSTRQLDDIMKDHDFA